MCGIVAYIGNDNYFDYIVNGLKLLQNRGYDSAGISFLYNSFVETYKYASTDVNNSILLLEENIPTDKISNIAIGHTRWATHGQKNDANAHPHCDNNNCFHIVHNGIIENYQVLKNELLKEGFSFYSQTDTEIIAVLLSKYYSVNNDIEQSIQETVRRLQGTWALVIIHKDYPDNIWLTRNGSPLLLGINNDFAIIVSEQLAFNNSVKSYIIIENHDIINVSRSNGLITYTSKETYTLTNKKHDLIEIKPEDYPHWTLKEIMEQPHSIDRATNFGGRFYDNNSVRLGGLEQHKPKLLDCEHIILLGCGTSYHSCLWSTDIFKQLDIFNTVQLFDGAEFDIKDIPKKGKTCLVLCSQSGETKDLHRCVQIAKDYDLTTIGVVNVVDSLIARETDCGVYLNAGRENAVASTKSFTNMSVILSMVAIWFSQHKGTSITKRKNIIDAIRCLPFQIQKVCQNNQLRTYSRFLDKNTMFILGKDKEVAISKEGSLKIKEICYIHAEGYSSSALKHGPFALVENLLPIIILDIGEKNRNKNKNAYEELKSRNANIIYITDDEQPHVENFIKIEKNDIFGGLIANVCIQLIAYYKAISHNINPDYPRNLAKVVTVE
jgi:glutamine---fructose-6-phosphate transaminase (isomerizing)|uniref:Glutamine--fructose-6-phosphate aminotransferase [isomerizing] n=1 Tax=viral metagenome TaxID=1070528 RepID=A0A6C0IMQ2_9ZZZZ